MLGRRRRQNHGHFYPRSPRGERPRSASCPPHCRTFLSTLPARGATVVSSPRIRASLFLSTLPARGATEHHQSAHPLDELFLSTLPARGATSASAFSFAMNWISIHAPREGSDLGFPDCKHFERRFLSTLPARGATANVLKNKRLPSAAFV